MSAYQDPLINGATVTPAPALARAIWGGGSDILRVGSSVDILAIDPGARIDQVHGDVSGVPARTACWIRHWPERHAFAQYRSCDLADLDIADADWDRLLKPGL